MRPPDAREVDAIEEHGELGGVELSGDRVFGQQWAAEAAGLEALVEDDEAAVVPGEDLHAVTAAGDEDEVVAREDVLAPGALDDGGQTVDAVAHVHRLTRQQNSHRAGKEQHPLTSARR